MDGGRIATGRHATTVPLCWTERNIFATLVHMQNGKGVSRDRLEELVRVVYGGNARRAAQHFGVTATTLTRIISGETRNPRMGQLVSIADSLGITIDSLLVPWNGGE